MVIFPSVPSTLMELLTYVNRQNDSFSKMVSTITFFTNIVHSNYPFINNNTPVIDFYFYGGVTFTDLNTNVPFLEEDKCKNHKDNVIHS